MAMEEIKKHPVGKDKELIITGFVMKQVVEKEENNKVKKAKQIVNDPKMMDTYNLSTELGESVFSIKVEDNKEQTR